MNKYFNNEIAAILKDSKEDPIVILTNRLKNYIKTADILRNSVLNFFRSKKYNQASACDKLISKLSIIFNLNKTNASDKIEEEWGVVNPTTIDPKEHFAAILGAFIAVFPEYAQQIPDKIRARLPVATNWFQHLGIEKQREALTNYINLYPNKVLQLFPVFIKTIQHEIVDTNIMKGLTGPDPEAFSESCETIKTIFQYIDDDKSTKVISELLDVIKKYQDLKAIETLGEIYPHIKSKVWQSEVIKWVSESIASNIFPCQSTFKTAATIYPHITEEQQTLIFNDIRNKLKKNSPEAVNAIKAISPHLTQGYEDLSSDFAQLANNFSHDIYSMREASAVACGALYKHMEAKNEALLNSFFDQLLSVMCEKKEEQPKDVPSTYRGTACISLATAYPYFITAKQKEKFFTALNLLPIELLPVQHQAFAMIYPYIEDDKTTDSENVSKPSKNPRDIIVTKLLTDINHKTVEIKSTAYNALGKIFLFLHPQKDSSHHNSIFATLLDFIKRDVENNYLYIACDALTEMKSNFSDKQTNELTNLILFNYGKKNYSRNPNLVLLGALIPLHQENRRQEIIDFLMQNIALSSCFPKAIIHCSPSEQLIAANYLARIVACKKPGDIDRSSQLLPSIWQILKNKECKEYNEEYQRRINHEIHESLPSLSSPLTRLICSYRR